MKPSEKAMQSAREFLGRQPEALVIALATAIDAHTTEALAEHVRVLDMAEKLASMASQVAAMELGTGSAPDFQPADFGLAADNLLTAIAELNALPCPPIEATKDK